MKTLVRTLALLFATATLSLAADGWLTDWPAAKAKAKAENKPILIKLTRSDTCPACIKLDKQVFSQKPFQDFAAEHLVLMIADYPVTKEVPAELKKQNEELDKLYYNEEEGYPSVWLLDPEGKKLSEDLGDPDKPVGAFIARLKQLLPAAKP